MAHPVGPFRCEACKAEQKVVWLRTPSDLRQHRGWHHADRPAAFKGHPLCYCASLSVGACDFCTGIRQTA